MLMYKPVSASFVFLRWNLKFSTFPAKVNPLDVKVPKSPFKWLLPIFRKKKSPKIHFNSTTQKFKYNVDYNKRTYTLVIYKKIAK